MGKIFCILGKTSSGKTTIEKELFEELKDRFEVESLMSVTTRPMRDYESQFDPYIFMDEEAFFEKVSNGEFAEYTGFRPSINEMWFYGTMLGDINLEKNYLKVINPLGFSQLKYHFGKEKVIGIYLKCNEKARLTRSLKREVNPNCHEICRRFLADEQDFKDIEEEMDFVVENNQPIGAVVKRLRSLWKK